MSGCDPISDHGQDNAVSGETDLSRGAWTSWFTSCVVSMMVAFVIDKIVFLDADLVDFISGWGLASVNALFSVGINVVAMKRQRHGFIAWGAAGNVLRVLVVLVIILTIKLSGLIGFESFVLVFLISYFIFMIAETVRMNVVNLRSMQGK